MRDHLREGQSLRNPQFLVPLVLWSLSHILDVETVDRNQILENSIIPTHSSIFYKIKIYQKCDELFN